MDKRLRTALVALGNDLIRHFWQSSYLTHVLNFNLSLKVAIHEQLTFVGLKLEVLDGHIHNLPLIKQPSVTQLVKARSQLAELFTELLKTLDTNGFICYVDHVIFDRTKMREAYLKQQRKWLVFTVEPNKDGTTEDDLKLQEETPAAGITQAIFKKTRKIVKHWKKVYQESKR